MAGMQVRDRIGSACRSSILVVCVASMVVSVGMIEGCAQKTNATGSKGHDMIRMECRCVAGTDLAALLKVKEDRLRADAIYAVGYIANRSGKTAYVKGRVIAKADHGRIGEGIVSVGLVSPNETTVEPFIVKVCNLVPHSVQLDEIKTEFVIEDVKFK